MKTFKQTDNLSDMRVGDILELADGTRHKAVSTYGIYGNICAECSMFKRNCYELQCGVFNFKQLPKMKNNLPKKVYILQFKGDDENKYVYHSWEDKNITGQYTEYVRADIAEKMAKDFLMWYCPLPEKRIDELFTEFINSRSK